ncbi:hypothetical protein [Deinococcus sp.]|uniref:hypothetical protein n=1 Tax=Deinococcus sp. TaxID=47478 RepID=UPI003C7A15E9
MTKPPMVPVLFPALLSALAFVSCTPALGVNPVLYQADRAEVLATVAQLCPTLTPNAAYRSFTVVSSTASTVVCSTKPVFAPSAFNLYDPVTLRFDATQSGTTASVTGSEDWGGTAITNQNALNDVFSALDRKFRRVR